MKGYIGYIRVSTAKQGTQGVSLQEQRDSILRYAERNHYSIALWLEETETAAKRGRPIFSRAMSLLRSGKAKGLILHKLDRGARNLRDWAAIGELSDQGIEVHFVNEQLDLQSRGGRLSADIQAVVAADYIRNLREETRKGFYGRLKQGFYPLRAPIGYLDQGKAKPKSIDPVRGLLVRRAFELYASGQFNLDSLAEELHRLGLRNKRGGRITRNGLSTMLNNPFYVGIIRIRKTSESFPGIHEPLVSKAIFDRAQAVLSGKVNPRTQRHSFQFRRLLSCGGCGYSLIGERQKGHVYYRCHSKPCRGTSVREERAEEKADKLVQCVMFSAEEMAYLHTRVLTMQKTQATRIEQEKSSQALRLAALTDRLDRLTDAFLDQSLDKSEYEDRKSRLLLERKGTEEKLKLLEHESAKKLQKVEEFLELASVAWLSYQAAFPDEKREMLSILTSNRVVRSKDVELEPSIAFQPIVARSKSTDCDPSRDRLRTLDAILENLATLNLRGELPDLTRMSCD